MSSDIRVQGASADIVYPAAIPFALVHLSCFAAIWTGVTWRAVAICVALYWLRIFAVGAGYHRYFSHRAYSTSRTFQFLLAFLAQSSAQNSVLWWAAKHRHHHRYADTLEDLHSPVRRGFFYSHVGWIFDRKHDGTDFVKIEDFARYPELMWLHQLELAPAVIVGILCFLFAGWSGVVVGFFLEHRSCLPLDLLHQFARARERQETISDGRRISQQLGPRNLHHGGGVAQQSSRLSKQCSPGS
ncbi:acyl-CoA desaturase [Caulobacter sp. S45]|uniref:acyl-CoA desaturase n=1 Tax=Caulobacter sp. S45 TaxID=1641861 RepID=UPI0020B1072C|nr:acyl-CoA desaturase [Caulobacter sp. S45]